MDVIPSIRNYLLHTFLSHCQIMIAIFLLFCYLPFTILSAHPSYLTTTYFYPPYSVDQSDVRFEWERIKLANEILSDKKLRLKYDRIEAIHEALADPELAFCRMVDALGWCALEVGKGIFTLGELAVEYVVTQMDESTSSSELVPAFATCGARSTSIPTSDTFSSNIYDANPASQPQRTASRLPNSNSPLSSSGILSSSSRLRWKSLSTTALRYSRSSDDSFLLEDFTTSDGEVVNPYRTLKVGRNAQRDEIRQSYRALSKKYHPDGVRFREVMPGKCNNLDDVRDEWERIKLSYEILSDKKMRMKYDRHTAIHDPLGAMGRATLSTMGWAVMETGKGIFSIGGMAVKHMANMTNNVEDTNRHIEK